jgi:hypothetical protein
VATRKMTSGDRIALVTALSNATIKPFDEMDWSGFAGAEGEAHMINFRRDDLVQLCVRFGIHL